MYDLDGRMFLYLVVKSGSIIVVNILIKDGVLINEWDNLF